MPDIIRRLPVTLANRIAAGEVVQRPASVVKELLENAVDAGADRISLAVRDGGASLIMVGDNGVGMSNTDARLCFERHATSKIHHPDDLFRILTKGFRGEALASIAAVARVELKTRQHEDPVGTRVVMDGGHLQVHELCQTSPGSVISVKNLFFNTPARRKFLKSEAAETRLITEEFIRVALPHPEIHFEYFNNEAQVYTLARSGLLERIVALMGKELENRLLSVRESTDIVRVHGFVFKADFSRKTRPEQYLFVNQRYIKHSLINHAIESAYEGLIPAGHKPGYFLFLEVDPGELDVNIHPTKTEVKFADERSIYLIVRSAVRQALGIHHMASALQFDEEPAVARALSALPKPASGGSGGGTSPAMPWNKSSESHPSPKGFLETLYPELAARMQGLESNTQASQAAPLIPDSDKQAEPPPSKVLTFQGRYLVAVTGGGLLLVHYTYALERIFFEQMALEKSRASQAQQLLFPLQIHLGRPVLQEFQENANLLQKAGFVLEPLGVDQLVAYAHPAGMEPSQVPEVVRDYFSDEGLPGVGHIGDADLRRHVRLSHLMARSAGLCRSPERAEQTLAALFSCAEPEMSPMGKRCFVQIPTEQLESWFMGTKVFV